MALLTKDLLADRASGFLRRLDLNLLAPDARQIAISQRIAATPTTFAEIMAASARLLGLNVAAA